MPPESRSPNDANVDPLRRRALLASGSALAAGALAGCIDDGSAVGTDDPGTADDGGIAIVSSPAGFHDRAFNDDALAGLETAREEYGVEIDHVEETDQSQYVSVQANLAERGEYDLIVLVGYQHYDALATNADEYPDQRWMLLTEHVEAPNVSSWPRRNDQLAFLAGVAAGTLTREPIEHAGSSTTPDEGIVGFVGGEDIDLINAFEQSFVEGVAWVDDGAEVLIAYSASFDDPAGVEDLASAQFDDGADVVWHAAAAAGEGAFRAADDNDRFAMGTDVDQSVTLDAYADVILGSAVLDLEAATYEAASAVIQGEWDRVAGERSLDVESGAVDFVAGRAFAGTLPDALGENLAAAKAALVDGDVGLTCGPAGCY